MEKIFEDFQGIKKEEWLKKVEADLKGRLIEELNWKLEDDITIKPFYTSEDSSEQKAAILGEKQKNEWKVGEDFEVKSFINTNKQLINALENGVNAPRLILTQKLKEKDFAKLFKGLVPSYVYLKLKLEMSAWEAAAFIQELHAYWVSNQIECEELKGCFEIDPNLSLAEKKELISAIQSHFPLFDLGLIDGEKSYQKVANKTNELSAILNQLNDCLELASLFSGLYSKLRVSIKIGNDFFVEIAKIRALKVMWYNLLKANGLKLEELKIDAYAAEVDLADDPNTIKIQSTTQAMAAVIGGADCLTISPSDHSEENIDFSKRTARNIQHLLSMESYFERVMDPAAGSYYVEELTEQLGKKAWGQFITS